MRWLAILSVASTLAGAAWAQNAVRPVGMSVVIEEQPLGPELVEVTATRPDYPADLMRAQIAELGRLTQSTPRGLYVTTAAIGGSASRGKFLKAKFAVDRLVDRARGVLWLQPVVQAFAGAPEPFTIHTLSVRYAGERPNDGTITAYNSEALGLVGTVTNSPPGIEYLIALKTQDPRALTIPERHSPTVAATPRTAPKRAFPAMVWVLVGVAALAAGCLVYFAALALGRRGPAPSRRSDR